MKPSSETSYFLSTSQSKFKASKDVQIQVAIHSAQSTKRTLRVLGHFKKDAKIMPKLRLVASSICFKVMRPCPSTSICLNWLSLAHQTEGKATMKCFVEGSLQCLCLVYPQKKKHGKWNGSIWKPCFQLCQLHIRDDWSC